MKIMVNITEDEYKMLKAYASAKRKHETGKGFPVEQAISEMISIGLDALSETIILDKNGVPVDWNHFCRSDLNEPTVRQIYRKY